MAAILEISYLDIEIIPDLLKHIIIHAEYHLAAIQCNKMQPKAFLGSIIGFNGIGGHFGYGTWNIC